MSQFRITEDDKARVEAGERALQALHKIIPKLSSSSFEVRRLGVETRDLAARLEMITFREWRSGSILSFISPLDIGLLDTLVALLSRQNEDAHIHLRADILALRDILSRRLK